MINWIISNIATVIVSLIIILIVSFVIAKMIKDKKNGKSSCGCGCANCAMNGSCHK